MNMRLKMVAAVMLAAAATAIGADAQSRPTRQVKMPTEQGEASPVQNDYETYQTGFFMSGEAATGWSLDSGRDNMGFTEVAATGGYRFSEYLRVGLGIGARVYYHDDARYSAHHWGMPLYVNLRGNFIESGYRNAVPFWSVDCGATFPDGFMVRPMVGVRVGQERSAFVASIGYMGQQIRQAGDAKPVQGEQGIEMYEIDPDHTFCSFITLKLGYEF